MSGTARWLSDPAAEVKTLEEAMSRLVPCGETVYVSEAEIFRRSDSLPEALRQVIERDGHLRAVWCKLAYSAVEWGLTKVLAALVMAGHASKMSIMGAFTSQMQECTCRLRRQVG